MWLIAFVFGWLWMGWWQVLKFRDMSQKLVRCIYGSSQKHTEKISQQRMQLMNILFYFISIGWKPYWTLIMRTPLEAAGSTHLPLWFISSHVDFRSFLFCYLGFSFHFLPARCLTKHFAFFLHCAAFPHFLSLSASSRCLIHQHLLKLCVVLCINVLCLMSVSLHMQKSWKKVCKIMWKSLTFGTLLSQMEAWGQAAHFWHAAWPHTSVGKEHGWQNRRCHGAGICSSKNDTLHRYVAPEHANLKAKWFLTSNRLGRVWHERTAS